VAVLGCQTLTMDLGTTGAAVPDLIATGLAARGIELVERQHLVAALSEQELAQSGLMDPEQASRVGRLVGARILLVERLVQVDQNVYLTVKAINAETGRVKAVARSVNIREARPASLVAGLLPDIERILVSDLAAAAPDDDAQTKATVLKIREALGNAKLPVVALVIPESELRMQVPDPAAQTELAFLMRKSGFRVVENDAPELDRWAKDQAAGKPSPFPVDAAGIEVLIYGSAIAEPTPQRIGLASARARLELTALDVRTGEVLAIDRATSGGADISDAVALKTALANAARSLAPRFLGDLVRARH
jgi:hypothetical protein